jgi:pimeloyl-ACP methyl ester carboxylesterase
MNPAASSDHVTPYDRFALDEATLIALLAAPTQNESLVEYFGAELHAELVTLARATHGRRPRGRRVYVLPGIMGSQLGFTRGGQKPADVLWLDPIDIQLGRLVELELADNTRAVALGAMNYTYLKITLSLRKAGFDAVLLDYDWRRDVATLGKLLAQRIAADGGQRVAIVAHSMGGLVARAALTHAAGAQVSQLIMLGTPNAGSLGAVQALRGTYSVVRKVAMLDLRHDAEFLASEVFATFPGLHELLPSGPRAPLDLFDMATWPTRGPGPKAAMLRRTADLARRLAPADARFTVVVGCNRITATGVTLRDDDFEYEYSLRGDGTVPVALAELEGARHRYLDCGHSDLPLSDRVIAGTLDLLKTGSTRRFTAKPHIRRASRARVRDAELRQEYQGKVDWPHMSPEERRIFLDTLNEPPQRLRPRPPTGPGSSPRSRAKRPGSRRAKPVSTKRPRRQPSR